MPTLQAIYNPTVVEHVGWAPPTETARWSGTSVGWAPPTKVAR